MNNYDKKVFKIYVLFCLTFILITTNYLSLNDIIFAANQTDVLSYIEISKNAPLIPKDNSIIIKHVAQRFSIPYLVGILSFYLNINFFIIFKIITFLFIFFYIFLINKIIKKFSLSLRESILIFSLLFLNPYIIRNHIFNPVQAHDMLFFCFSLIFILTLIEKKYSINTLVTVSSLYLRQTSIAFFIGSSIFLLKNKKIKLFIYLLIGYLFSILLLFQIGEYISLNKFPIKNAYGILFYNFQEIEKLLKFLLLGAMPFFPLGYVILFANLNKSLEMHKLFIIFIVCLMIIGQPILGGPDHSTNNVGRLTNLSYPILTVLLFYIFNFKKLIQKKYFFYIFIVGMFFWSLHPTFSIFKIFGFLRFYNY